MASNPQTYRKKTYFEVLDLVRALAAFLVVLQHSRNMFFVDFADARNHSIFWRLFYFVTNFGHQAVIIFFVLSGFVVGRICIEQTKKQTWSWGHYLYNRLTRLWVVLVPCLLLTGMWDLISIKFAPAGSVALGGTLGHSIHGPFAEHLRGIDFSGNVLFLQTIFCPTYGSNSPLWSLANEFWYYLLFPCFYIALFDTRFFVLKRILLILAGVTGLVLVGHEIAELFIVWLMGVGAFWFQDRFPLATRREQSLIFIFAGMIFAGTMAAVRFDHSFVQGIGADLLLGIAVGIFCYAAVFISLQKNIQSIAKVGSGFSYSLYLAHMPLIAFIGSIFIKTDADRWQPRASAIMLYCGMVIGVYLYAYFIALCTEHQTDTTRRWIWKMLSNKSSQHA